MSHIQVNARQQLILDRMALYGEVKLAELKESFDVTEMTLRRDLEKLEQMGLLRRTFGGAILIGKDIALLERTHVLIDEKVKIGLQASIFGPVIRYLLMGVQQLSKLRSV